MNRTSILVSSAALFLCGLTFAYALVRFRYFQDSDMVPSVKPQEERPRHASAFRAIRDRISLIFHLPTVFSELLVASVLTSRGISGLSHVPIAARRIEETWLFVVYIAIGVAQMIAVVSDHRFGRRLCALGQAVVWLTLSIMIYKIDGEFTNAFPVFGLFMAWVAIRLGRV